MVDHGTQVLILVDSTQGFQWFATTVGPESFFTAVNHGMSELGS